MLRWWESLVNKSNTRLSCPPSSMRSSKSNTPPLVGPNHLVKWLGSGNPQWNRRPSFFCIRSNRACHRSYAYTRVLGLTWNTFWYRNHCSTNSPLPLPEGPAMITLLGCRIIVPTVEVDVCNDPCHLWLPFVYTVYRVPIYNRFWPLWPTPSWAHARFDEIGVVGRRVFIFFFFGRACRPILVVQSKGRELNEVFHRLS